LLLSFPCLLAKRRQAGMQNRKEMSQVALTSPPKFHISDMLNHGGLKALLLLLAPYDKYDNVQDITDIFILQ